MFKKVFGSILLFLLSSISFANLPPSGCQGHSRMAELFSISKPQCKKWLEDSVIAFKNKLEATKNICLQYQSDSVVGKNSILNCINALNIMEFEETESFDKANEKCTLLKDEFYKMILTPSGCDGYKSEKKAMNVAQVAVYVCLKTHE